MSRDRSQGEAAKRRPESPRAPVRALHVVVLWSFACAQPLFELLARTPTFFTARRMDTVDVWILAVGLVLVLPALLALACAVAGRAGSRFAWVLHLAVVGGLSALIALPALVGWLDSVPSAVLPVAAAIGSAGAWLYRSWRPMASLLTAGAVAPPIFAALFLLDPAIASIRGSGSNGADAAETDVGARAPVVLIVLDELPLYSLLDNELRINEQLFPNFAALASESTWFRNASAVHVDTADNLISILTGMRPRDVPGVALADAHARSLFTLLQPTHRLVVRETVTRMLPEQAEATGIGREPFWARTPQLGRDLFVVYAHMLLPEPHRAQLPPIRGRWQSFRTGAGTDRSLHRGAPSETLPDERSAIFRRFVARIDALPRRSLYFLHSDLPHSPFIYLPGGSYFAGDRRFLGRWGEEVWPSALAFQKHVLQLGWTDHLLGELIAALRATHLYDASVLVVVSDHGVSFRPGHSARHLSDENIDDILRVACFVKRPHQRRGSIDDRNFEHSDLLPTIADALGVELAWPVDGRSGFAAAAPAERPNKTIRDRHQLTWSSDARLPQRPGALDRRVQLFGPKPGWDDVFAMGPRPELVGRPLRDLRLGASLGAAAVVDHRDLLARVDRSAEQRPNLIKGRIYAEPGALPEAVGIALGGTLHAVTYTFAREHDSVAFEAVVPDRALRNGRNAVALFDVGEGGELRPIALLDPPEARARE